MTYDNRFLNVYFWISLFALISCDRRITLNQDIDLANKYLVDTLVLKLDQFSTYQFNKFQYVDDDTIEVLYVFNDLNKSIDRYNLSIGSLETRIEFGRDPKYDFGFYSGFLFHNNDSIFLFQNMTLMKTVLINSKGAVQNTYLADNPIDDDSKLALNHAHVPGTPPYLFGSNIYFGIWTLKNTLFPGSIINDSKLNAVFSLSDDKVILTEYPKYPETYQNQTFPTHFAVFSRIIDSNGFWIYSWPISDSLFSYSFDFKQKKGFLAKTSLGKTVMEGGRVAQDPYGLDLIVGTSHYGRIIEDKYRNLYYRIVSIAGDKSKDLNQESIFSNKFSILVLNEHFEIVQEVLFPPETYNHWILFVGKKGLYAPRINPKYKEINEDELIFDIYDFKSLNNDNGH